MEVRRSRKVTRAVRVAVALAAIVAAPTVTSCSNAAHDCVEALATEGPRLAKAAESLDPVPGVEGILGCDDTSGPPIWMSWNRLPQGDRPAIEESLTDAGWALIDVERSVRSYGIDDEGGGLRIRIESFANGELDVVLARAEP